MRFTDYSKLNKLKTAHAFLSPSKSSWVNYTEEQLINAFGKELASSRGTRLHNLAKECILLGVRLPKTRQTINMYVNDAIGYRMTPEQILFYSENCFGTADTICFRRNMLRIHDYKSGVSKPSMRQLEIYAALFCLEYNVRPQEIDIELRIYFMNDIIVNIPDPELILYIMNKIIDSDKKVEILKLEE